MLNRFRKSQGFSLIELLAVLAIIGILSAVAIPSFLGQRRRARIIGDAKSNAAVLRMALEAHKADAGTYGVHSTVFLWSSSSTPSASVNPAPSFTPTKANTAMTYTVKVGATSLTYTLTVKDTTLGGASVYITDQNGNNTYTLQ